MENYIHKNYIASWHNFEDNVFLTGVEEIYHYCKKKNFYWRGMLPTGEGPS
jgi:hypothetical protein